MKLSEYSRQFNLRHDFVDSDLNVLSSKWPNIIFKNIPTDWIIPIDDFLCEINYFLGNEKIESIEQHFGQLIITTTSSDIPKKLISAQSRLEKTIAQIDADLSTDSVEGEIN